MPSPPNTMRSDAEITSMLDVKAEQLARVVSDAGRERAVLGLSGGIDSAVSLGIAARALGPENVTAVRLPSRHTEQVHLDDAALTAEAVSLPEENMLTISIEPLLAGLMRVRPDVTDNDLRFGNASARARMILIFDVAQTVHGLVIGTENRTENLLGYFTRFGDAASDIEPIADLYKTEVRSAARLLGLPESVLTKHPTAGLWGGQTDEDELGFTYHDADRSLVAIVDRGLGDEAASDLTGVDIDVVRRVRARAESVAWKLVVPHTLSVV